MVIPIQEIAIDVLPPVTANGAIQVDGVLSLTLHNNGTLNATINGHLTLKPGSTLQLATPHPYSVIEDWIRVEFAAGAGTRLVEIAVLRMKGGKFSNYEKQLYA